MSDTYTCADCGETFKKGWSDEEANAEAEENFGCDGASENPFMATVCDDCYQKLLPSIKDHGAVAVDYSKGSDITAVATFDNGRVVNFTLPRLTGERDEGDR